MIKYSFIIPTYNNEKLLRNALFALNHLTPLDRDDYEVIVVDDGSDRDTYEAINNINKKYSMKYVYLERNEMSSRAKARNAGIAKAEGEYIVFIDADIIVKPNFLEELDRCYRLKKDMIVVGTRILLQEPVEDMAGKNGSLFDNDYFKDKGATPEFREEVFNDLSYNAATMKAPFLYCFTCNLAVPKIWLNKVNGFDEDLKKWGIEDIELIYRMYELGLKIVFNSKNQVVHQFHGIKQGKFVQKNQEEEVDYNSEVFIKKHPQAMGLDNDKLKQLFRSIATRYKSIETPLSSTENCMIINFKEEETLEEIKEVIQQALELETTNIIIYDYVETTDLDIWIQLQDVRGKVVKYYPVSKQTKEIEEVCDNQI